MRIALPVILAAACLYLAALAGCGALKEKTYTPTEAEAKFVEFCRKEGQVEVTARQVGRTERIFLAMDEPIFNLKAGESSEKPTRQPMPFSLLSLDGEYFATEFRIDYDIVPDVLPPEAVTYGSSYNEHYTKKRQLVYQAIQEAFFNLAKDEETKATAPVFFVVVVSDVSKGIATKSTFYLPDLKAFMTEAIPFEEYYLRENTEIFGDEKLIGDRTGRQLALEEVAWPDFLTAQIKNRIRFKFSHSDFPPKADPDREVLEAVTNTLRFYPFTDFTAVYLHNRREKREMTFTKDQLKIFEETPDWEKKKGRITVIRFPFTNSVPGSATGDEKPTDTNQPETAQ
ncbi:MAG: hypothetical protein HGA80_01430 [Candidatus Omnitrophica bacterium]|nr:hypothetical protein [Candidatus Omnitrophota bacterium]